MISEWRSHRWHYFLVQNSSNCKPTKNRSNLHQIIVYNKFVFIQSVCGEHINCLWYSNIPMQNNSCIRYILIEHSFVVVILLWVVYIIKEEMSIVQTLEISLHKNNKCVLRRLMQYSLVPLTLSMNHVV